MPLLSKYYKSKSCGSQDESNNANKAKSPWKKADKTIYDVPETNDCCEKIDMLKNSSKPMMRDVNYKF